MRGGTRGEENEATRPRGKDGKDPKDEAHAVGGETREAGGQARTGHGRGGATEAGHDWMAKDSHGVCVTRARQRAPSGGRDDRPG
jgi:hypothetical protein